MAEVSPEIVRFVIGSAVLFAMALAADRLLRQRSAGLRYHLLFSTFVAVLILPIATGLLPAVELQMGAADHNGALPLTRGMISAADSGSRYLHEGLIASVLFWIWLAGALFLNVRMAIGRARLHRTLSIARKPDLVLLQTERLRRAMGIRRSVTISICDAVETPFTTGHFRPRIIFPADAAEWTQKRQLLVLKHELAHVQRFDSFRLLVAEITATLCWFNPLAWCAVRRLRLSCEQACDDQVITSGERPSVYASHLLALACGTGDALFGATLARAAGPGLEPRIVALADACCDRRPLSLFSAISWLLTLSAVGCLLATAKPMLRAAPRFQIAAVDPRPRSTQASGAPSDLSAPGPHVQYPQFSLAPPKHGVVSIPARRERASLDSADAVGSVTNSGQGDGIGSGSGAGYGYGAGSDGSVSISTTAAEHERNDG